MQAKDPIGNNEIAQKMKLKSSSLHTVSCIKRKEPGKILHGFTCRWTD